MARLLLTAVLLLTTPGCIGIAGTRGVVAQSDHGEADAGFVQWWWQFGEARGVAFELRDAIELHAVAQTREDYSFLTIGLFVPVLPWPPGIADFFRSQPVGELILSLRFTGPGRPIDLSDARVVFRSEAGEERAFPVPPGGVYPEWQGFDVKLPVAIADGAVFSITIVGAKAGGADLDIPTLHLRRIRNWRFVPFNA